MSVKTLTDSGQFREISIGRRRQKTSYGLLTYEYDAVVRKR